ncbi:MAG: Rnase Y domain-containing protein, partial [bacterium]
MSSFILGLVFFFSCFLVGYVLHNLWDWYRKYQARKEARRIIDDARRSTEETPEAIEEKKRELDRYRDSLETEIEGIESEIESHQ